METTNQRTIPVWANSKAAKLGVPGFTATYGEVFTVKVKDDSAAAGYIEVERVTVTVVGAPIVIPNFRFLGRVDFEEGVTLVNARPGETIPARYFHATTYCDHCTSQRQRNMVYIFRRDGGEQHIQVGRTCLKDFMGHDPEAVLNSTRLEGSLFDAIDEEVGRGGRESPVIWLDSVLEMAAAVIRHNNGAFMSKGSASKINERGDLFVPATSDLVFDQLFPQTPRPKGWVKITPEAQDVERAAAAKAWCLESMTDLSNDYQHNLRELMGAERIKIRRIGIVTSLLGVYARHLGELVKREAAVNLHVGTAGQRREFVAKFAGSTTYETDYGTMFIGRFETTEGLAVYKGGSPFWDMDTKEGDEVVFTATIKCHGEFNGRKQTMIQRAKVKEAVAA